MSKLLLVLSLAACASRSETPAPAPATPAAQVTLDQQAATTLGEMRARDPGLDSMLPASAGYAVFPEIGAAGALIAGGAFGRGVLYQHGAAVGYVKALAPEARRDVVRVPRGRSDPERVHVRWRRGVTADRVVEGARCHQEHRAPRRRSGRAQGHVHALARHRHPGDDASARQGRR